MTDSLHSLLITFLGCACWLHLLAVPVCSTALTPPLLQEGIFVDGFLSPPESISSEGPTLDLRGDLLVSQVQTLDSNGQNAVSEMGSVFEVSSN